MNRFPAAGMGKPTVSGSATPSSLVTRIASDSKPRTSSRVPAAVPSVGEVLDAALVLVRSGAMTSEGYESLASSLFTRHFDAIHDEIHGTAAQVELERGGV